MTNTTDDDSYDLGYDLLKIYEENLTSETLVEEVQDWVKREGLPGLPSDLVVLFLITNDNDTAAAKEHIITYFEVKQDAPELFDNRNVDGSDIVKATNTILVVYPPMRTHDNCSVIITKLLDTNYKHFELTSALKFGFMIMDLIQMASPPVGFHSIIDMKGSGIMHLTHFKLNMLKKFFRYVQEALPVPMRNVHVVNTTIVFYRFLGLARIVIKPEVLKLIRVQKPGSDISINEFLKDYIPVQCLPQEYGGLLPTIPELQVANIDQLHAMAPYFEAEEKSRKMSEINFKKFAMVSKKNGKVASSNRMSERDSEGGQESKSQRMSKVGSTSDVTSSRNKIT